jgi:hypothetical protein
MSCLAPTKTSECVDPTERERQDLVACAKEQLGRWLDDFIETGNLPSHLHSGGGTLGPLRDARSVDFNRSLVAIWRPSKIEAETARSWHDHCAEHGYPTGDLCGADEDPENGYPPRPVHDRKGVWVALTWRAIRAELRRESAPRQLDLFGALA